MTSLGVLAPRLLPVRRAPDPIPKLKQEVAAAIVARLDAWTQPMAAELLCSTQARVSNLRTGKLERFSLQNLIRMAARLNAEVRVDVRWPHPFEARRKAEERRR
jgi:predicted XRE-type DNA-binding protein